MWSNDAKIRMIIGMSGKNIVWTKHQFFLKYRPKDMPVSLRPNPLGNCVIQDILSGPRCVFTDVKKYRTVFVNQPVVKGVFRWTIQFSYNQKGDYTEFYIGSAPPGLLGLCDCNCPGDIMGTSSFCFWKSFDGRLGSCLCGANNVHNIPCEETTVPDGSFVSIEADSAAHTLAFFVGDTKIPHTISRINFPLHFGVSTSNRGAESSFASVSFRILPSATPSAVVCTMHEVCN